MGTNYYHHSDVCEHCGGSRANEHIGKSSGGWTFSFHGTDLIRSWKQWRAHLEAGGEIRDEYNRIIPLDEFVALVERKRGGTNHTLYCRTHHPEHAKDDCWLDEDGHSFSRGEFS